MNSTALLFNGAFKMSVEQPADSSSQRDTVTQRNSDDGVFEQLVDNMNVGTGRAAALMVPSRSDASVSEWIAAVTMSKLALGQFATNVSKTNTGTGQPVPTKRSGGKVAVPLQRAIPTDTQTASSSTARLISNQQQAFGQLIQERVPAAYSAKAALSSVSQKMFETKPQIAEKIAPRLVRILGADNSATLYIRDYLQSDTSLQRDLGVLLHAAGADGVYQHVVINGINQSRKIF